MSAAVVTFPSAPPEARMLDEQECWNAVLARDRRFDGRFLFGVRTTGVFCRPSCAARRPRRENVRFFASADAAERAGLRACRRCHPTRATGAIVTQVCAFIRQNCDGGDDVGLPALAARAGQSVSHFQRVFRAQVGLTPRQFVEACRRESLKQRLRDGRSVTEAIYEAGFGSGSRVYGQTDRWLGMTPREYRLRGQQLEISHAFAATPFGLLLIAATDRGLCFAQFGAARAELLKALESEYPAAQLAATTRPKDSHLKRWVDALVSHLRGQPAALDLPLDVRATAFQFRVWDYLCSIPRGEVRSYAEVARAIGQPSATRAVARACASNTVAIAIPCHRVIRADGQPGGYRWGLDRKRRLLALERPAS